MWDLQKQFVYLPIAFVNVTQIFVTQIFVKLTFVAMIKNRQQNFLLNQQISFCSACETPIYLEQFCLVYVRNTCSIWYYIQFVCIAIFMSLHVPTGACIPVASGLQFMYFQYNVYLSIVVHTNIVYIYIHTRT